MGTHNNDKPDKGDKTIKTDKVNNKDIIKKTKSYKILQLNKGNSDFDSKQDQINFIIKEEKADIVFISEANNKHTDPSKMYSMKKTFKNYKIEESQQKDNDKSRCIMLINKKLYYERLSVDNSKNPIITIKLKLKNINPHP